MRPGKLKVFFFATALLGLVVASLWYFNLLPGRPRQPASPPAPISIRPLSVDSLASTARRLYDSLELLDRAIHDAQVQSGVAPASLISIHQDLWARYTWVRARISSAQEDTLPGKPAVAAPAPRAAAAARAEPPAAARTGGIDDWLQRIALWLWIALGVAIAGFVVLLYLLGRRRRLHEREIEESHRTPIRLATPRAPAPPDRRVDPLDFSRSLRPTPATVEPPRESAPARPDQPRPVVAPAMPEPRAAAPRPAPDAVPPPASARPERPTTPPLPAPPDADKTSAGFWENSASAPAHPAPAEPTSVQDYVVSMAKRGRTPAEIARRLRIPQDQVELILKLRRNA